MGSTDKQLLPRHIELIDAYLPCCRAGNICSIFACLTIFLNRKKGASSGSRGKRLPQRDNRENVSCFLLQRHRSYFSKVSPLGSEVPRWRLSDHLNECPAASLRLLPRDCSCLRLRGSLRGQPPGLNVRNPDAIEV